MATKVFVEQLSQPSRLVVAYCQIEKIPVEIVYLRIAKLENRTPEFRKISPNFKVPALSDQLQDGSTFNLFESHTMIRYLAEKYNKSVLYPLKDLQFKATIDSYLDWHHTNTRKCAPYLFAIYFAPKLGMKIEINEQQALKEVSDALTFISKHWLQNGKNNFIGNNKQLTVADISCYSELAQMKFDDYDFKSKFPVIHSWMERMEQIPEIQSTHKVLFELAPKIKKNKPANQTPKL